MGQVSAARDGDEVVPDLHLPPSALAIDRRAGRQDSLWMLKSGVK